jgi:hypothetical protein
LPDADRSDLLPDAWKQAQAGSRAVDSRVVAESLPEDSTLLPIHYVTAAPDAYFKTAINSLRVSEGHRARR